ncbi:MAG: hypothetical protein ACUVQV_06365 [Dissulfurimicrobium sp.]|uniref:hypothetical protein n=1 Tax=Dissulfurimicrobium sp. TaxID=2022436 RepID=UPI00404B6E7E
MLALKEARLEYATAQRELELVTQRFSLKLATNQDMAAAQKALDQAGVRLKHLEDQGIAIDKFIKEKGISFLRSGMALQRDIL